MLDNKKSSKAKIATEPIKVYKILESSNKSPFMEFQYRANKIYNSPLEKICGWLETYVNHGMHTFKTFKDALRESNDSFYKDVKIVEMFIPVGAKYYTGTWEGAKGYASNQIETKSLKRVVK